MKKITRVISGLSFVFLLLTNGINAQSDKIIDNYENFIEAPREVAYVHLNKSTYIEGEIMGFTAFVFDKSTKESSKQTSNLYCTISNKDGKVIKKKMIKVDHGIASNVFDVDSTLSTGIFTFKAYTNWMRNFDENNHFEQTFKVIDADNLGEVKPVSSKDINIDLQALGEGGHMLYNISNTIGIIAKNQFGYGIANAYGNIKDNNGAIVSEFQLNDVGLAKALFNPISGQTYSVNLNLNERTVSEEIKDIKPLGVVMSLIPAKENIRLNIKTNPQTLKSLKNETFQVALHNGSEMILSEFEINDKGSTVLTFSRKELFSGTNIFTIFDQNNKPILERLYFNNNITQQKISKVSLKPSKDSLDISLNIAGLDTSKLSNLSVSVLPSSTKSYNHHNNILSQVYIQPYIKGNIEKGAMYFASDTRENEYNLDLLMLTQGWSSYNWNSIFTSKDRKYVYPFERGIDVVANINNGKTGSFIVYPMRNNNTQLFDVPKNEDAFTIKTSFPEENDLFRIGYVNTTSKDYKERPNLYLQFYPSKFPNFEADYNVLEEIYLDNDLSVNSNDQGKAWSNITKVNKLDEVTLYSKRKYTKIEKLKEKAIVGRFDIVQENIKKRGMRVDIYLQRLGFATDFDIFSGKLSISNPRGTAKDKTPLVYLDGALLTTQGKNSDFSILTFLNMNVIDYIEYELYGVGGGIRGQAGYIKIHTSPGTESVLKKDNVLTYEVPLKFEGEKEFYTPKYQFYNTDFFKEYGVIDWQPKLNFDAKGNIEFKFYDTQTDNVSLFIEGIINGKDFISQRVDIQRTSL